MIFVITKKEISMKHARADYDEIQDPRNIIPEDEPVFLLRGQDKFAWQVVSLYADLAQRGGASPELVASCREHAQKMKEWQTKKIPDMPEGASERPEASPTETPSGEESTGNGGLVSGDHSTAEMQ
jgi:hypothetical protein